MFRLTIAALALSLTAGSALACGQDSDCMVGERSYRLAMPEGHDGTSKVPVVVFAHGYRGTAAGVMRNGSLRRAVSDLGAALIALNADGGSWMLPNHPRDMDNDGASEFAYVDSVLADAAQQFAIDDARIMVTGFSAGGMLVWNLACARSDSFAAFAPIAGTFWLEPPETCAGPVASIIHIHGSSDRTVPLEGRAIGPTKQGEVDEALAMYQGYGAYGAFSSPVRYGDLACEEADNPSGDMMKFCLFDGGHSFRTEFVRFAWEQFRQSGRL
ncbi:prolyl oligopeptidase family serine peptidase [uncultured Roseobacter sp.]|uniref:alpha/beta hydrolase family esterase n=1 Tax=uncultured Roseobacter sp. TaxID=114847 RepID=UPI002624584C|nr:prolyl oligopeptidase family serine peptidase [uncultured Roseobacter sp.]